MPQALIDLGYFAAFGFVLFAACCGYLTARALLYMWHAIVDPLFRAVAYLLPGGWRVLGHTIVPDLRQGWLDIAAGVHQSLQNWAVGSEIEIAFAWHQMGRAWRWNAAMVEWLAHETDQTFHALAHIHLPKWAKWIVAGTFPPLLIARLIRALLPHIHVRASAITTYITKQFPRTIVHLGPKAIAAAFPGIADIPWIKKEIYGLTRRNLRIAKRIRLLEGLLTVAGFAAALAKVWGVSLRCVRHNGPIGRTARSLCGLPTQLLDDLLGILADVWILENVCVLLPLLESAAADIGAPLVSALTDVTAGLCKGSIGAAKPLRGPKAVVPPVTYGTSLVGV